MNIRNIGIEIFIKLVRLFSNYYLSCRAMCARFVKSQEDEEALLYANELLKAVNLNLNSNGFLNEKVALDLCRKIRKLLTIYEKIEIKQNSEIFSVLQELSILQRQLARLQKLSNLNRRTTDIRVRLYGLDTFQKNQFLVQLGLIRLNLSPSLTGSRNTAVALFQDKEKAVGIARSIL